MNARRRRVRLSQQRRLFDDVFKVDELIVAHERQDGSMSADKRRLVLERGDAAAVLLFNRDRNAVILVEQFKAPTLIGRRRDNAANTDGWIIEPVAGVVEAGESPQEAAIRECREETGYRIGQLRSIATFFTSAGGTSERVFLYFAEVGDHDVAPTAAAMEGEDISIIEMPVATLFESLDAGRIDDSKLIIAAYWLRRKAGQP